jgi:thiamine-monophosphate kinase
VTGVAAQGPSDGSGEDRLIARYFRPLAKHPGALGLGDDAAVIKPPSGCDLVLKTDGVISGVHFFPDDPPETVAKKVLRMNLSDLAAKGAKPMGFLLAIALPQDVPESWLAAFARGLDDDARIYDCPLLGGDTDRTPGPLSISISALGTVPHGTMVRRGGAKASDRVVVTGTIGDAALGLKLRRDPGLAKRWGLSDTQRDELIDRYRLPRPRNILAESLRRWASSAMDISDGLAGDLAKLFRNAPVAADIETARVPLSDAARQALAVDPSLIEAVVTGGDDYEILATVSVTNLEPMHAAASAVDVPLTEIGGVKDGRGETQLLDSLGRPCTFARPSFSHF